MYTVTKMIPLTLIFLLQFAVMQCELIKDPSLKPADPFSADDDAKEIRDQMTKTLAAINRDKISKIFFRKTYEQRKAIEKSYDDKFCQDKNAKKCTLHSAFKDISTNFMEALYVDSLISPQGILAITIQDSVATGDGEVGAIEEIVCGNDKPMKDLISQYYKDNYGINVEDDLARFRNDDKDYQNVMLKHCWKGLSQDKKISPQDADKEAQALRKIDPKNDKDGFKKKLNELFEKTSEPDLKQIFEKYRQDKNGIDDAINDAFDCERVKRAYNFLARYVENTGKFYADQLYENVKSFLPLIVRCARINRIVLSRCERDLLHIFNTYKEIHDNKTFTNHLKTLLVDKSVFYYIVPEKHYVEAIRFLCGKT